MNSIKTSNKSSEMTMADLLAKSKYQIKGFSQGQKVMAKVIAKTGSSVVFDIGGKSEGLLIDKAYSEVRPFAKSLNIGDEILTQVLIPETREGYTILSLRQASQGASWKKLEEARAKGEAVIVLGKGVNPSGITVEVEGLIGFIPGSQLGKAVAQNTESLIGKYFKAKPVEIDRETNKVVLSEKEVSEAGDIKAVKEALAKIKEGEILDGVVTTIASFGCFVKVSIPGQKSEATVEGLVHISELSWSRVADVADVVKEGDRVKVMVIGKSASSGRQGNSKLSLSLRHAQADPWQAVPEKYKPETRVQGKVSKISDFGVFIELEPGVEGLIHITKIPPATKLSAGQAVNCFVEEIDPKNKKIALGLVLSSKPIGYK